MSDVATFQLHDVRKHYGDTVAVDVEALEVPSGAVFCLLGPTGSGKSTLLRLLAGVEQQTSGEILFKGRSMTTLSLFERRCITMVFQRPLLLSTTVSKNIEYGVKLRGKSATDGRCRSIMERLGLTRLVSQYAPTLSGGQTHLVALARTLACDPDVLLIDEPTAHLDPANVALVEELLAEEHQSRGTTVVWFTHNLFQARRMASHVALLLNGRIIEVGRCEEFFHSPMDVRTSDFIEGKMVY